MPDDPTQPSQPSQPSLTAPAQAAPPSRPQPALAPPDLSGWKIDNRYEIERTIGAGGMGAVYRARQMSLDKRVAIKLLKPEYAHNETYVQRFLQEARAASRIRHRNVVDIIDFGGLPGGSVYFVMELLEGNDLSWLIRRERRLAWSRARGILIQVVRALRAAHKHGIIHRDVKPANVFLVRGRDDVEGDFVKMLDFGIAKITHKRTLTDELTATDELIGTATYMAPEQAQTATADARSDIYSLGVVAYKMLTGTVPFKGETSFQILTQHVGTPPPPLRQHNPAIPATVEALVLRALAKDPRARYQTMSEFEEAIAAVDEHGALRTGPRPVVPSGPYPPVVQQPHRQWRPTPAMVAATGGALGQPAAAPADHEDAQTRLAVRRSPRPRPPPRTIAVPRRTGLALGLSIVVALAAGTGVGYGVYRYTNATQAQPTTTAVASPTAGPEADAAEAPTPDPAVAAKAPIAPTREVPPDPAASPKADAPPADATDGVTADPPGPPDETKPEPDPAPAKRAKKRRPKTDATVMRSLTRRARSRCHEGVDRTVVEVAFTIGSAGEVILPRPRPPHQNSAVGQCVVTVLRAARFPAGDMRARTVKVTF